MRVLVCGSRTYDDEQSVWTALAGYLAVYKQVTVIEGGAKGADRAARGWATVQLRNVGHELYAANWEKDGKAAGPIRNQRMLDEGKPTMVLAFVDKPLAESRGTHDMVRRAKRAQVPVYVVEKL